MVILPLFSDYWLFSTCWLLLPFIYAIIYTILLAIIADTLFTWYYATIIIFLCFSILHALITLHFADTLMPFAIIETLLFFHIIVITLTLHYYAYAITLRHVYLLMLFIILYVIFANMVTTSLPLVIITNINNISLRINTITNIIVNIIIINTPSSSSIADWSLNLVIWLLLSEYNITLSSFNISWSFLHYIAFELAYGHHFGDTGIVFY